VILTTPEGSPAFRDAKLRVWKKHASRIDETLLTNVFERQKRRLGTLYSSVIETKGQIDSALVNAARLEREKAKLIDDGAKQHHEIVGHSLRVRELEGAMQSLSTM